MGRPGGAQGPYESLHRRPSQSRVLLGPARPPAPSGKFGAHQGRPLTCGHQDALRLSGRARACAQARGAITLTPGGIGCFVLHRTAWSRISSPAALGQGCDPWRGTLTIYQSWQVGGRYLPTPMLFRSARTVSHHPVSAQSGRLARTSRSSRCSTPAPRVAHSARSVCHRTHTVHAEVVGPTTSTRTATTLLCFPASLWGPSAT